MTIVAPARPSLDPRAWPLVLFVLACLLGGNAPPQHAPGGEPPVGDLGLLCPAPDPVTSPLPADLPLAETVAAGALPGSFAVSRSGGATYTIPLVVPPGRAGMEPSLAIAYDSAGGDGLLGVGFGLSGLSVITRCPASLAQDGLIRAVRYDALDHFCLDGTRLVEVAAAFDLDGSGTREYRTIPDSFAKIVAHFGPGADHPNGPDRFEVDTRAGRLVDYGATANGRAMARGGVVAAWWVTRERDRRDNEIDYRYASSADPNDGHTREIVPLRIEYAHGADHLPRRAVQLTAPDGPSPTTYFSGGMRLDRTKLLARVDLMTEPGDVVVRSYHLDHGKSQGTERPLLRSVTECAGAGGPCYPATRFGWSSHPAAGFTRTLTPKVIPDDAFSHKERMGWLLADVNGDGLDDLVLSHPRPGNSGIDEWWVSLNTGGAFGAAVRWASFPYPAHPGAWNATPIDYDQDGLTDIFLDAEDTTWTTYRWLRARPDHTFELLDTGVARPPSIAPLSDPADFDRHRFLRLGDVNGDGLADLIECVNAHYEDDEKPSYPHWTVHLWSPSGFESAPRTIPIIDGVTDCGWGKTSIYVSDVDGDGTAELVVPFLGGTYGVVRHVAGDDWMTEPIHLLRDPTRTFTRLHFLDTNGDGLSDVIMTGFGQFGCYDADYNLLATACGAAPDDGEWSADLPFLFTNKGGQFTDLTPTLAGSLDGGSWTDLYGDAATPIDYDGDGRMDLLMPIGGHCGDGTANPCWVVLKAPSGGAGHLAPVDTHIPATTDVGYGYTIPPGFVVQVTDVDGDGRQDLVVPDPDDPTRFAVYRNDGPQDLLVSITDGLSPLDVGEPGAVPTVEIRYGSLVDTAVTKGLAVDSPERDSLPYIARSDPQNGCAYPRACVVGPARVVESYALANGRNEARTFFVKYRDGRYHRRGRGFLGFGERLVIDGNTAAGSADFFDNLTHEAGWDAYPYAGQAVRSWAWTTAKPSRLDPGRVEVTFTERTLDLRETGAGQTYFTYTAAVRTRREEGVMTPGAGKNVLRFLAAAETTPLTVLGETWDVVVSQDDYGNVLMETHDAGDADLFTSVIRGYDNDPATWRLGELRHEQACSAALGKTQCRATALDYDGHGEVSAVTVGDPADAGTQLWVALAHDKYGHVTHTTAEDAFGHHREGCVSYDAEGIFPHAARNALGHTTYSKQDAGLGVVTAVIDANGLVTRFQHDGFGRVTEERRPDGTRATSTLARTRDGGPQSTWWNIKVTTQEDGGAIRTTALDSLGRAVRSLTVAAAVQTCGAAKCSPVLELEEETAYDFLGRVERVTLPWMVGDTLSGKLHHTYSYDAAGRMTKHVEPWGKVTTLAHSGNAEIAADWLGTTMTVSDGLGRTVKAFDRKDYVTETAYGPFGVPWQTTRFGTEVTTSERDAYGRVVREKDQDRGETHLSYNGFGEVLTVDDAAGRHADLVHDALGRLLTRTDQQGASVVEVTRWSYDAAHGLGKIAGVQNGDSVKQTTYDALSRPEGIALALGGETFAASFGYDGQGRLHRTTYPQASGVDPLVVLRDYDAYGNLVKVRDNTGGKPYWQLTGLDGAGRPAVETFGNGTVAHREYEPGSGLLRHIQVGAGLGTKLQDLTYAHDASLRLRSRADGLQVGPKGVRTETFTHDELGRLTCARFADVPPGKASLSRAGPCALALEYAVNGNITHKSDVGAYTYDPSRPHAVQTAGAASFGYDDVGNQTERSGLGIEYTAFDLPRVVTDTGSGMAAAGFAYDGDQRRIRKQTPTEVTVYFQDMYERVTTAEGPAVHRYYVAAGSATLVLTRQAGQGKGSVAYLHPEALGSTDVVVDGAGGIVQRRSYDAFGARRHPLWGTPPVGAFASKVSRVGFTGHEDEDDLGLVNMRGRIFDPKLGRFLQTDPVVSAPWWGQSWNPYSYVHNSPLNFVDPSGFAGVTTLDPILIVGQRPTMEERMGGVLNRLGAGMKPDVAPPSSASDATFVPRTATQAAVRDDAPAHTPQAVAERSPFAPNAPPAESAGPTGSGSAAAERPRYDDAAPLLPFFLPVPSQYIRPYQEPPAGAPAGLAAIRQMNGQPGVAVANFSRDYAPGTHVRNLTLHAMDALAGGISAAVPFGRLDAFTRGEAAASAVFGDGCFVAGTGVLTPTGVRAVESLEAGDLLVSRDADAPATAWRPALAVSEEREGAESDRAFDGRARAPGMADVVWVLAESEWPAQHVPLADARPRARVAFQGKVYETRRAGTALEIRETGETLQRVLQAIRRGAHRLVEITLRTSRGEAAITGTSEHPFYVPARGGFVAMGELTPGMTLLAEGGEDAEVVTVRSQAASVAVFNVEVERTHAYFVCAGLYEGCALVHNGGPCFQRPLIPADLGLEGTDAIVEGTFRLKAGQAVIKVAYLGSPGKQLAAHARAIIPRLKDLARAQGATSMRIETSYIIEMTGGLDRLLVRLGFQARNNGTMFLESAL
jgi:RHS repeat-associated protein